MGEGSVWPQGGHLAVGSLVVFFLLLFYFTF